MVAQNINNRPDDSWNIRGSRFKDKNENSKGQKEFRELVERPKEFSRDKPNGSQTVHRKIATAGGQILIGGHS